MTYGYMRHYEDRVRRAVNTPDRRGQLRAVAGRHGTEHPGRFGGWRYSRHGRRSPAPSASSAKARAGSGSPTGKWSTSSGRCGRSAGKDNQLGRPFPRLTYTDADADGLTLLEAAPRNVRGARDLLSVALQYGNAFGQGLQAAALKPADFFGNDDVLYLMEDMATGEIRLSILWEWLHKQADVHGRRRRRRDCGEGRRSYHGRALRASARGRGTESCAAPATVMSTTSRRTQPCRSRAR